MAEATERLPVDAWFAGFFDAEGSICVQSRRHPELPIDGSITLEVGQSDDGTVCRLFQNRFGGSLRVQPSRPPRHMRPEWRWRLHKRDAVHRAIVVFLQHCRNAWKRHFLTIAHDVCTLPPGILRASMCEHMKRAKQSEKQKGECDILHSADEEASLPTVSLGWLCGFFDGDGAVSCITTGRTARLDVTQTEPHAELVLRPFLERWGGNLAWYRPRNDKWRIVCHWKLERHTDVTMAATELLQACCHPDKTRHLRIAAELFSPFERGLTTRRRILWQLLRNDKDTMRKAIGLCPLGDGGSGSVATSSTSSDEDTDRKTKARSETVE